MNEFVETLADVDPAKAADGTLEPPRVDEIEGAPDPAEGGDSDARLLEAGSQAQRAVLLGLAHQGMREKPCPTNRNPYSKYFGYGPQYWCADFVAWCFDRTGNRDRKVPWGYPSSVANITVWAQRRGLIVSSPRRGDIFTRRDGAHAGLVVGVAGRTFSTIEGNTTGPDGTTCWVARQKRAVNDGRYWYVRWPW